MASLTCRMRSVKMAILRISTVVQKSAKSKKTTSALQPYRTSAIARQGSKKMSQWKLVWSYARFHTRLGGSPIPLMIAGALNTTCGVPVESNAYTTATWPCYHRRSGGRCLLMQRSKIRVACRIQGMCDQLYRLLVRDGKEFYGRVRVRRPVLLE